MTVEAPRSAIPFAVLAERGFLWHDHIRVPLNKLDAQLSVDVQNAFMRGVSKVYVYPIPCHVLPSIIVATILVNTFGRCMDRKRVPRVLFYTGIDGRELYRDLGVGPQREKISATFGFTRLDGEGLPIEPVNLTSQLPLVVTGHCVLPKDQGYRPDVVVVDADAFEGGKLDSLIVQAARRWPAAKFYMVVSNPISPLIGTSSKLGWRLIDLLHNVGAVGGATADAEFGNVAAQLQQLHHRVRYRCGVVADEPSASWRDLRDSLSLAHKHRRTSRTARKFAAIARLITSMSVLPSEYDEYRTANMLSLSDRLKSIRDDARHEGRDAQLIAGGCSVLSDVLAELEQRNWKRDAVLELLLEHCYAGKSVTVLVERPGMRSILAQAMQVCPEFIDMQNEGRLRILAAADVSHAPCSDVLIVPGVLSMSDMWALRTTIAPEMIIVSYSLEVALQNWCLREIGVLTADESLVASKEENATDGSPEVPQQDALSFDLADLLLSDAVASEDQGSTPVEILSGPRRQIWFEDGSCCVLPDSAAVHVVLDAAEPLQEKRARSVEPGDWLVIVNGDAQQSLFEALREHVDSKTGLSRALDTVRAFHYALRTAHNASGFTVDQLHARLVELGSDIHWPLSIGQWIDGTRFGPSDAMDIHRLGEALTIPLFKTHYLEFYRGMQRVRVAHRELGRILVRVIKQAYRDTDSKSVRITVDGETVVLYDVLEAVALKRVQQIKEMR